MLLLTHTPECDAGSIKNFRVIFRQSMESAPTQHHKEFNYPLISSGNSCLGNQERLGIGLADQMLPLNRQEIVHPRPVFGYQAIIP